MANRYFTPDEQYADSTGAALSGAQLFFYVSGTSTKQNTYSDSALATPNTNPVVLDSSGRAGSIFLQNLKYKVVLAPANDTDPPASPIWTMDPVYTSDVSTIAQVQSVNGNPNGQLAGTAGSATIPASMAWDYTNDILYICTTTGTSTTAVWTAVNPASSSATIPAPQGRLTPTSNTPVINSDAAAATTVYYTPYMGLLVPIYNGTSVTPVSIASQLSIGLVAAHAANNIYDFFVFSLSGTPTLGTGPSWSAGTSGSVTAGSCARGTGAGGAALSRIGGILTNAVSMTMTYGPSGSTTAVPANQGTYVGSMYVDATNGQVTCHLSWGQNRKFGIWNYYNRVPIVLQVGDSTASWNYTTATIRASNNNPSSYSGASFNTGSGTNCNGMSLFTGLAEEAFFATFMQKITSTSSSAQVAMGIGFNATTAFSGTSSTGWTESGSATPFYLNSSYYPAAALGINVLASLEDGTPTGASVWFGTQANMNLICTYRG